MAYALGMPLALHTVTLSASDRIAIEDISAQPIDAISDIKVQSDGNAAAHDGHCVTRPGPSVRVGMGIGPTHPL